MSIYDFIYVKKKTQTFHCIYLKISSQNKFVLRHRATANNMCCFFIIWIISPFKRNEFMNYCLQDLLESEIYCVWAVLFDLHDNNLNWNLHSVEFNGLIALLFSVNGFFLPLIYWECELFCLILYIFCTLKYCFHPCAKFW